MHLGVNFICSLLYGPVDVCRGEVLALFFCSGNFSPVGHLFHFLLHDTSLVQKI